MLALSSHATKFLIVVLFTEPSLSVANTRSKRKAPPGVGGVISSHTGLNVALNRPFKEYQ